MELRMNKYRIYRFITPQRPMRSWSLCHPFNEMYNKIICLSLNVQLIKSVSKVYKQKHKNSLSLHSKREQAAVF